MKLMRIKLSSALALLLTFLLANPGYPQAYARYCNARFDYCIEYPVGFLSPQGEADNGDGQNFLSKDRSVSMKVWGSNNVFDERLEDRYKKELQDSKGNHPSSVVTYKTFRKNFFVASGYRGKWIFYKKTTLTNGVFKTLYFEYPASKQKTLEPIVTRASRSFP